MLFRLNTGVNLNVLSVKDSDFSTDFFDLFKELLHNSGQ
jgi:hypothetical protein